MHVDPDRILIVASRHFAQIKPDRVKRLMNTAMVSDIFQDTVHRADDAALTSDVLWRPRGLPAWVFRCDA